MAQKRAAIYCRISDDRRGTEAGVTRQREDCLALVEREGWTLASDDPHDTFTDNDISAYSGKVRPAYARLVNAIKAGEVDVVVAWHPDRLHRSVRELEDWIDLQEATRTKVVTVKAGEWDLSTAAGQTIARILGAVARGESQQKAERVRRAMLQRAEQGKVHGALRTYGYAGRRNDDGTHTLEVVPEEAAAIREAARRVLAGEALLSVVKDFNARGIPSLRGGQWSRSTLRGVLVSARVAGWREHTPGRTNDNQQGSLWRGGEFVAKAEWKGILTRQQVERLRRTLTDPARARKASGRTYLLSGGLAVCGVCQTPMRGRPTRDGKREYACTAAPVGKGCGGVSVKAEALEAYVVRLVRAAVESGEVTERLRVGSGDVDEAVALVSALETDLSSLSEDFGHGRISRAEWMAAREPLTARLESARRDLARRDGAESLALVSGGVTAWDRQWRAAQRADLLEKQRAMLRAMVAGVAIARGVPGRARWKDAEGNWQTFDPDRVSLDWRA